MSEEKKTDRVRVRDAMDAIWRPKDHMEHDTTQGVLVFTLLGKNDGRTDEYGKASTDGYPVLADTVDKKGNALIAEDREEAYAKSVHANGKAKYYVKRGNDGKLLNPTGLYTETKHSKTKRVGMELWIFREVDRKTFFHYLRFLTSRNIAWLNTAQRELI